jgi:hypothetical protein
MPWRRMKKWRYFSTICTIYRWVVGFTPWLLYPLGKSPLVSTGWEAEWAPEPAWMLWKTEKTLSPLEVEPQLLGCPSCSPSLYQLRHPGSIQWRYMQEFTLSVKDMFSHSLSSFTECRGVKECSCFTLTSYQPGDRISWLRWGSSAPPGKC